MPIRSAARAASLLVVAALAALLVVPGGAASAAGTAQTYVVQGVPGASVDVTVDGKLVQSGVAAKQVLGPLDLSPGRHTLSFATADWTVSHTVDVTGSQDVVLHWPADAADKPVVTVFANDVSAVRPGQGRLMVAHTAVVPPADIVADGKVLFSNIANGEFVSAVVPAATYHVAVVPTGGGAPLLGPVALPVKADALTRVFAIGAPRNGSMDAVVQVLPVPTSGGAQPAAVHAGEAGLVAPDGRVVPTARGMSGLLSLAVRSTGLLAWWPHG